MSIDDDVMDDKTLLERAAKAAGYEIREVRCVSPFLDVWYHYALKDAELDNEGNYFEWNPLTDDGDALRLAVKLRLDVNFYPNSEEVGAVKHRRHEICHRAFARVVSDDWGAATRRAIVRAAADYQ